jgi:hypothetical protein
VLAFTPYIIFHLQGDSIRKRFGISNYKSRRNLKMKKVGSTGPVDSRKIDIAAIPPVLLAATLVNMSFLSTCVLRRENML